MKTAIPSRFVFMLAGVALLTVAGCATMRPISSRPPVARIVLSAPFSTSAWQGVLPPTPYSVILPAGEYHPVYEDDNYFYYQAPSKVVVNDLGSLLFDGGIYVQRGTTAPRGWYYVEADGSQKIGRFNTPPPTR